MTNALAHQANLLQHAGIDYMTHCHCTCTIIASGASTWKGRRRHVQTWLYKKRLTERAALARW